MKVAIISPTQYLSELSSYKNNRYHMVLAQRILDDEEYAQYYKDKSLTSDIEIILDNGACELQQSIDSESLLRCIELVRPNIVVLPDKLGDVEMTIRLSREFISKLKKLNGYSPLLMGVSQGRNREEWFSCFDFFAKNPDVAILGISKTYEGKVSYSEYARVETVKYLLANKLIPKDKKVHLLGLPDSGHIELMQLCKFDVIEGVDTSAPVVHGAADIVFTPGKPYKKIPYYLPNDTLISRAKIKNIKMNIDVLFESANYLV